MHTDKDEAYLRLIVNAIRASANFKPAFGRGRKGGLTLADFQRLYQSDPFYRWFGLDNPKMYVAHRAAGAITSIYRHIGEACENLLKQIFCDYLNLSPDDLRWSYTVSRTAGRAQTVYVDARVLVASIPEEPLRTRFREWMYTLGTSIGVDQKVLDAIAGVVFEIRQGYKSKDAKRQNADITTAVTAYANGYLPCMLVLSTQVDSDVLSRYRNAKWGVLMGYLGENNPCVSTYDFIGEVIGYDLAGFFERNSAYIREEFDKVLAELMEVEADL